MDSSSPIPWERYKRAASEAVSYRHTGRVSQVVGMLIEGIGPAVSIGELCDVVPESGVAIKAEVVGFRGDAVLLMPLGPFQGIYPGSLIISHGSQTTISVGEGLLGRVIDPLGAPMDDLPALRLDEQAPLHAEAINPMKRRRIDAPLDLGIRAINAMLTVGRGQRIGIFAGSGVGKSTLLAMMARYTAADVIVIGLVGERGREVVEFLQKHLGPQGLARSVVVVATSDQPPLLRLRAAYMATAVAEYFRGKGQHVLLLMDSVTRFAMAQREIGLSRGEPPTTRGYPPSAFMILPKLLERAGRDEGTGSITGLYTVLMEGDDLQDPIVDTVRGILDGHIMLSRDLAIEGHYPPIDVLGSISRLMDDIASAEHKKLAQQARETLATYAKAEDMINIGAYVKGSNPRVDRAIRLIDGVRQFLRQPVEERSPLEESVRRLRAIMGQG